MRELCRRVVLVLIVLVLATAPTSADWLVTRAGGRVETKGPWQLKGKLVVFTQPDGSLASLRLAEVDLQASEQATAERMEAKASASTDAPSAPKKKLAILTDATIVHSRKEPANKPADPDAKESSPAAKPQGTVTVANWRRLENADGDGIEIQGTLQNNTDKIAANVSVEVQLYNEAGEQIATASGIAGATSIHPNGLTEFRASFPGVFAFADAKFETKGWPLDLSPASSPESAKGSVPPQ
jgi:hypothetical protein